jgi:Uma2 family endonuclease
MASSTAISVEQYLHTAYQPDCDYVDGELVERNVGELKHSFLQSILGAYLRQLSRPLQIRVATELRLRIGPTRYRIPDLTVMLRDQPLEPVPTRPPFLCIEIVSPEDRMSRLTERVKEYLAFGVKHVWVVDPETRTAFSYTREESREVRDNLTTQNPEISISLPELFAELDRDLNPQA